MKLKRNTLLIYLFLILCCAIKIQTQNPQNRTFESCGISNPVEPRDCLIHDTPDNSCCYYQYRSDAAGCIWLGTRFNGYSNYGALYVQCNSYINKLAIWSLFLVIFILI
jgi:hypothetical protein